MQDYYDQFETVFRDVVEERYRRSARKIAQFLKLLLGFGVSVVSDPTNLLTAPFEVSYIIFENFSLPYTIPSSLHEDDLEKRIALKKVPEVYFQFCNDSEFVFNCQSIVF